MMAERSGGAWSRLVARRPATIGKDGLDQAANALPGRPTPAVYDSHR